jgi:glyoxylase-like metal-dependent hydrolase (beta-lactamase superfamily II)
VTARLIRLGEATLTRISYAEVPIDPTIVGLTPEEVRDLPWSNPVWADGEQVLASASAWVIESGGARIVVDPAQAVDGLLRDDANASTHQEAFAARMTEAGFPRESITHAVATHLDGTGMLAWREDDGTWGPFFQNASVIVAQRELDAVDRGEHPADLGRLAELRAAGAVAGVDNGTKLTADVTLEHTGAHTPGHQIVRIASGGETAVHVGHLAVAALHVATGPSPSQHIDADAAWKALQMLRDSDVLLLGPLWPTPGAGTWDGAALVPAELA